ncbi:MAG: hypothetical protein ACRCV5_05495 [Afipia sp.]
MIATTPFARLIGRPADRGAALLEGRFLVESKRSRTDNARQKKSENCGCAAPGGNPHGLLPDIIILTGLRWSGMQWKPSMNKLQK